ncbi:MAG TPA: class I SAM-dependent methyltransferase [Candidatus Solibacter sp.]|nr:class I SAM-dependent methyltransferase [Candidatus Solibacter sp.]
MNEIEKASQERLYPSLKNPYYLQLRSRRLNFQLWIRALDGRSLKILDIGGRLQPYRPLFQNVVQYVGVDLVVTECVNIVADAERLALASSGFDVVIATQVFEYIRDPRNAVAEILRVLKPGGVLLGSFAACTPKVGEEEYWRFTASGLRLMLSGFESVEVLPEIYSIGGAVRMVNLALDTFAPGGLLRRIYRMTMCPMFNLAGLGAEKLRLTENDQFTPNYSVRGVKAAAS